MYPLLSISTSDLSPLEIASHSFETGLNISITNECKKIRRKSQPTTGFFRLYIRDLK